MNNELSKFLLGFPDLNAYVGLTVKIIGVLLAVLGIFLIITITYNFVSTLVSSKGKQIINISKLGNVIVLVLFLTFYIPISYTICQVMSGIEFLTRPNISKENIEKTFAIKEDLEESEYNSNTEDDSYTADNSYGWYADNPRPDPLANIDLSHFDLTEEEKAEAVSETITANKKKKSRLGLLVKASSMMSLADVLKPIIRLIIVFLNKQLIILFFVLGPFAVIFSILPGFQDKFITWLKAYITVLFVPIVFNILDSVVVSSFVWVLNYGGSIDSMIFNVINWVTIVLYLLPYWIAGKVVGCADTGRFLAMTTQVAGMAAGIAMKFLGSVGGGAGAGAGAAAGSAGKATDSSKDAMSS